MAIFTLEQYRNMFPRNGKIVRSWTVIRWIKNNQLPTHHIPRKVHNRQWIIEINFDSVENLRDACICFHRYKKDYENNPIEWCNTVSVKYNIDANYLKTILGL